MRVSLSAVRSRGRMVIKYYAVGEQSSIACPECSFSRDLSLGDGLPPAGSLTNGPVELSCPYCEIPLGVISSPLEPLPML